MALIQNFRTKRKVRLQVLCVAALSTSKTLLDYQRQDGAAGGSLSPPRRDEESAESDDDNYVQEKRVKKKKNRRPEEGRPREKKRKRKEPAVAQEIDFASMDPDEGWHFLYSLRSNVAEGIV